MDTTSYWAATASFPRFPSIKGGCAVDVVVIGAGITGTTAAFLCKQAGYKVALVERGRCGGFDSLNTTAHLTPVLDTRLHKLMRVFGKENARTAWEAGMTALSIIATNVREQKIACELKWVPGYLHAHSRRPQKQEIELLQTDARLAQELGFPSEYQTTVPGYEVPGVRFANVARFHPGKYLQSLLRTVPGKGSFVFENTEVTGVQKDPQAVVAGDHSIRCEYIILATHNPLSGNAPLLSSTLLQTKLSLYSSYAVGAKLPKGTWPEACFWDTDNPYHYLRVDSQKDADYAIYGGEDHKTGQQKNIVAIYQRLEKKLKQLIPKARVEHRWSGQVIETVDGLPYIGPMGKNQFVATGFAGNGMTFGTLSARMALDFIEQRENPWASLFDVRRKKVRGAAWTFLKENKDYPLLLIKGRLKGAEGKSLRALPANQGRILKLNGRQAAAYRDPEGKLTLCSPVCTHLKCIVAWNDAEKTWDCPCHGSRFAATGEVLSGPAERPLEPFIKNGS